MVVWRPSIHSAIISEAGNVRIASPIVICRNIHLIFAMIHLCSLNVSSKSIGPAQITWVCNQLSHFSFCVSTFSAALTISAGHRETSQHECPDAARIH